jgi:hypothetical protein
MDVRTCGARPHIFKAPSAPECTKIAAPAHVRVRRARTHTKGLRESSILIILLAS